MRGTCTSLDHIYPAQRDASPLPGTPCYCGRRTWAGAPRVRPLRKGDRVLCLGEERTVAECDEGDVRVEPAVNGRRWFEAGEVRRAS